MQPISRRHALILGGLGTASIIAGGTGLFWGANTGFVPSTGEDLAEPKVLRSINGALQLKLKAAEGPCHVLAICAGVGSDTRLDTLPCASTRAARVCVPPRSRAMA